MNVREDEFWVIRNTKTGMFLAKEKRYVWREMEYATFTSKKEAIRVLKKQVSNGYYSRGIFEYGEILKCKRTLELSDPMTSFECYNNNHGASQVDKLIEELKELSNAELIMNIRNQNETYRTIAKHLAMLRKRDGTVVGEGENPCKECNEDCTFSCPHA